MKTIALYLPQFHRIKENDEWWGEGYTEWTAVKKTKPLYKTHCQPRVPLNNNYYDLMCKKTMEWQAALAEKYKIDGFSFYHYYFRDGRLILEKPAENLLKWKDIKINYFFSWDPSSWARSWTALGNSWADTFEKGMDGKGVLIEQKIGDKKEWENHFRYLMKFFKDERYIKVDGKPVFNILVPHIIPCFDRMIAYWRNRIIDEGFNGLYIITTDGYFESADACVNAMSPEKNCVQEVIKNDVKIYDYDNVWKNYLGYRHKTSIDNIWQCMVDYDDTARRGERARILKGVTPQKFKEYFAALKYKSINTHNPFVFINAWNEWGEGMYLEPDITNEYKFLEAVRDVNEKKYYQLKEYVQGLDFYKEADVGENQSSDNEYLTLEKYHRNYNFMMEWVKVRLNDKVIKKYLIRHGYKNVAIYGFGCHGNMVYKELIQDGIVVPYIIDRRSSQLKKSGLNVVSPEDAFPKCDLIVVSITNNLPEVYDVLYKKTDCPILTMHELCMYANEEYSELNC